MIQMQPGTVCHKNQPSTGKTSTTMNINANSAKTDMAKTWRTAGELKIRIGAETAQAERVLPGFMGRLRCELCRGYARVGTVTRTTPTRLPAEGLRTHAQYGHSGRTGATENGLRSAQSASPTAESNVKVS